MDAQENQETSSLQIHFRCSENSKINEKESPAILFQSEPSETPPNLIKKKGKNLLDLIRVDPQAKLWECILTSIISINDFCEKGLKNELNVQSLLEDQNSFLTLCKEKQNLKMQQIIFNRNNESAKESLLQIKSHSNPLRRLDSRDQKHSFFIEASLKKENKIDLALNFKVTEYGYELFSLLRKMNNISIEGIRESFNLDKNFNSELNIANTSEFFGKSGATFFFSHDNKYVLKSISQGNAKKFISNFPKYFTYLLNNNEESLMVRIYGMYKISVEGYEKTFFIMMENLTENLVDHLILRVYDLKGSKFQRSQENFKGDFEEQNKILKSIFGEGLNKNLHQISDTFLTDQILIVRGKDNDFLDSDDVFIELKKEDKINFFANLQNDVKFFEQSNLMDYSLIFMKALKNPFADKNNEINNHNGFNEQKEEGINENEQTGEEIEQKKEEIKPKIIHKAAAYRKFRSYESPNKKFIYSLAIVDYLQNYDLLKLMETQIKNMFKEKSQEISCIDAQSYGKRFLRFIISIIQSDI